MKDEIVVYGKGRGEVKLDFDKEAETIWASQKQIAELFCVDVRTVNEHIKNVYRQGELEAEGTVRKIRIVQKEGTRDVARETIFYNLDAVISVGYRVNSRKATDFRKWATKVLKQYIVEGVAVNEGRLKQLDMEKLREVEGVMGVVGRLVAAKELEAGEASGVLEVLAKYTKSWEILRDVGSGKIVFGGKKSRKEFDVATVRNVAGKMREEMGESEGFGEPRVDIDKMLAEVGGQKSVQEAAARLLYRVVKGRMFEDGNKRIGAVLFVMYLTMNGVLLGDKMGDKMLVAMVMLMAESLPEEQNVVEGVVARLLKDK